jgi:hypothetical protein
LNKHRQHHHIESRHLNSSSLFCYFEKPESLPLSFVFSPGHLREVARLASPNQVFYQLSTGDRIVSTDSKARNLETSLGYSNVCFYTLEFWCARESSNGLKLHYDGSQGSWTPPRTVGGSPKWSRWQCTSPADRTRATTENPYPDGRYYRCQS